MIETFWSRDINDVRVLAYMSQKYQTRKLYQILIHNLFVSK